MATAALQDAQGVYLAAYLKPFTHWLDDESVSEILVNEPGRVWLDRSGAMEEIVVPSVDDVLLTRLAEQVARVTHQGISRAQPLLAATLPDGARVQFVGPPATRRHWAMAIRRHRVVDVELEAYASAAVVAPGDDLSANPMAAPLAYLRAAVRRRRTILISGGTSSGKTTFLNALLREVPRHERIVLVEDTPEIRAAQPNTVGLVSVKGPLGESKISTDDLLQASLRLRPDRIVLGELRGVEAVSFLRAINTGHPGSFSTIHANNPAGALEQLALMVMQANLGLTRSDTLAYAHSVIDLVVQLERDASGRRINAILDVSTLRS